MSSRTVTISGVACPCGSSAIYDRKRLLCEACNVRHRRAGTLQDVPLAANYLHVCPTCDASYLTPGALSLHVRTPHTKTCKHCGCLMTATGAKEHMRYAHPEKVRIGGAMAPRPHETREVMPDVLPIDVEIITAAFEIEACKGDRIMAATVDGKRRALLGLIGRRVRERV